jgi:DNA-binding LacI/PurR family transcriptional regulator
MLVRARIPFVSVNPSREHVTNAIALDDVAVACRATQYLIARGHTRIAYVPFQSLSHRSQLERMQGYTSALTQAGLAPLPYWDQPLPLPAEQPAELCRRLQCWRTQHDCSALVVYNGTLAPRVLCACYTRGVHIPQDLSVICCDASPVYGLLPQMFTHIALERIEIGRRAVAMLEQRLATHADVPAVVLHGELREGATVACLARDSLTSPTPSTI